MVICPLLLCFVEKAKLHWQCKHYEKLYVTVNKVKPWRINKLHIITQ